MAPLTMSAVIGLILSFLSYSPLVSASVSKQEYVEWVINATNVLDEWYDASNGLWADTWWNSGCMLATMGNVALIDKDAFGYAIDWYVSHTFNNNVRPTGSFLDTFYDDEGWWALGWIKAYDVTGNTTYLDMAASISENMLQGNQAACGGHWWNKAASNPDGTQGNTAIGNTLYLATVASLGNRIPDKAAYYRQYAQREMQFFMTSGIIDFETWVVHDNLATTDGCQPADWTFSYDMGTFIGGLIEYAKLSNNDSYIDMAAKVANGTIYDLSASQNGILTDMGYPAPENTLIAQFKGVFMRNLMYLQEVQPDDRWVSFIQNNANSIYTHNRAPNGTLGSLWQGPYYYAGVQGHSSALDALVAAATVTN